MGVNVPYDENKLTPEQRDKLDKWNQNKQMITHLSDVADMTQEMVSLLEKESKSGEKSTKEMGALLADMRNSLSELKDKEAPESPDTAKPVVDALNKLETALTGSIKAIDVKPNVKVDAPQVNVDAPKVDIDLTQIEKILKTDLPKAFKESISKIPKPDKLDTKPLLDAWKGISKQLESLETATRLKPSPGAMAISNLADITTQTDALTDAELRATPVPISGTVTTTAPEGAASSEIQEQQTGILDEIRSAIQAVASARGIAADLRVTLLGGTTAVTGTLTAVTTVTGITNIGGIPAVGLVPANQNTVAVLSNINNVSV